MNQDIINKTLAMNLFEENNKSSNWFVVEYLNINVSRYYFTENIPFHYFQYICLWLTYSNYWLERFDSSVWFNPDTCSEKLTKAYMKFCKRMKLNYEN